MMRRSWLAVGFGVALTLHSSALFAQLKSENPSQTGAGETIAQEQTPVDLNLTWELVPRPPIKFTPFDMVDPNTGKPVKPDDLIEVNGVKMKAGEFYRRLNETERWLNAHGYSLRTDTVFEYYSPELESQIADSERRLRELEAKMPIEGEPGGVLNNGSDFMPAACTSDSRAFDTGWYGNSFYGIRFYGSGGFQACSDNLSATVSGQAVLSGRIASIQANIAEATANASGRLTSLFPRVTIDYNYAINVKVFGNTIWGPSGSGNIQPPYRNSWNWTILNRQWSSPTIRIACVSLFGIPICIDGQVGANLSINLAASVDIDVLAQAATATPYGSATGWAAAWVGANAGIARAEAGVRGSLNFFNGSLQGTANGNFSFVNNCLQYNLNAQLNASLTALSGTIDAYVRGCIWFFGWRCAEASTRLFSWSGISWNRTLGSYSGSYNLFCQ